MIQGSFHILVAQNVIVIELFTALNNEIETKPLIKNVYYINEYLN